MAENEPKLIIVSDSDFYQLNQIDIKKYTKQKGRFDYFPWADAHQLMRSYDPESDVKEKWFEHYELLSVEGHPPHLITKLQPYQKTENSSFVLVQVTFKGKEESEIYPILDFKNQDIPNPTMTQVNKALKRGFVKALAKHGLGLYIYRGEDLPESPTITIKELEQIEKLIQTLASLAGMDPTETLIERTNKIIKQNYDYLDSIKTLDSMNKEQSGLIKRVINDATEKAKLNNKEVK